MGGGFTRGMHKLRTRRFLRSGLSLLLLAAVLWSLAPPEQALSAPEPRATPLAHVALRWSPLDALDGLLRLLGLRADPPAGAQTSATVPDAAGPGHQCDLILES